MGKAFKAAYAKQSLERDKKSKPKNKSSKPWTVSHNDESTHLLVPSQTGGQSSRQHRLSGESAFTPANVHIPSHSGGPNSASAISDPTAGYGRTSPSVPSGIDPYAPSAPSMLGNADPHRPTGHIDPYASGAVGYTSPEEEASQLETEIIALHAKIHDLETRIGVAGGDEEAILELTVQLSVQQQALDEKGRRLFTLQEEMMESRVNGGSSPRVSGSSLPDIDSISLEDAEWFQAGLPR